MRSNSSTACDLTTITDQPQLPIITSVANNSNVQIHNRSIISVTNTVVNTLEKKERTQHYHLFPGLKKQLKVYHFSSDVKVIAAAETWLDGQPSEFFLIGLQKLEQRAKKCIELRVECVE
jgi:hypothetical protein